MVSLNDTDELLIDDASDVIYDDLVDAGNTFEFRKLLRFFGPGGLISVGYMDPGNWATDLSAGSQFNYSLLSAVLFSGFCGMLLQVLSARLGMVTGDDLPTLCRKSFSPWLNWFLYIGAEVTIIACDLAEVIGSAIALKLLFGIPLSFGVVITAFDVIVILMGFGAKRIRGYEIFILMIVATIALCFLSLIITTGPDWGLVVAGYIPTGKLFVDRAALFNVLGIVGATVMPHNLYLHSHLVLYRQAPMTESGLGCINDVADSSLKTGADPLLRPAWQRRLLPRAIMYAEIDCLGALCLAFFVNSAILIVAAAAFFPSGSMVVSITNAHDLLSTSLGEWVGIVFAIALLCAGQSSTITATLAGQVVMQGFIGPSFKIPAWSRRLLSRSLAIVPALMTALRSDSLDALLILSQVVLAIQLPFALWPLLYFTSSKEYMSVRFDPGLDQEVGQQPHAPVSFANGVMVGAVGALVGLLLTGLNLLLVLQYMIPSMCSA